MSYSLSSLKNWLPFATYDDRRSKKDDDAGIQEIKAWIQSQPVDLKNEEGHDKLSNLFVYESEAYGRMTIENLKKIPICSSNQDRVLLHLIKICQKNNLVKQYLMDHIDEIKAHPQVILSLRWGLLPY